MARSKSHRKGTAQQKAPLTHFLCLPLITAASKPQLSTSLDTFRAEVSSPPANGIQEPAEQTAEAGASADAAVTSRIHPKAIRPVGALHCTLGVMSLSKQKLDQAIDALKAIDIQSLLNEPFPEHQATPTTSQTTNHSSSASPIKISLKGLVSMHPPQKTSILYTAPQDPTERLYPFCLALQKEFRERGFLVPDDRPLKLHATLVNTIYAKGKKHKPPKLCFSHQGTDPVARGPPPQQQQQQQEEDDPSQGHGPDANAPLKIDARGLLEKYKEFVWAQDVLLDRVAICEMGVKKKLDGEGNIIGEEYTEVASVPLPT